MTVTLKPGLEHDVRREAAVRGQEADEYVNRLVGAALRPPAPAIIRSALTPEEVQRLRRESLERAAARNLPASTSEFRREDLYDDEDGR